MIPSGFKHRNSWILTLLMTASYKVQFRIKITWSFIIYFLNSRILFHCRKITEKGILLAWLWFGGASLNPKPHLVWRIGAISLRWIWASGLNHQWYVECPYQLKKKKEQSPFAWEWEQNKTATAVSLPKGIQRLNDVKVLGTTVRIKWNLLNNHNNN